MKQISPRANSLDALWMSAIPPDQTLNPKRFDPELLKGLPATAQRYLLHAIAPGTVLASAVRLQMHGEIKLKNWVPFTAEQVISWDEGMIWNATVLMRGIPVKGYDRLLDHEGAMQWKILGLIPMMRVTGADITRSVAGRILAESVWLPSVFCRSSVEWKEQETSQVSVSVTMEGERPELTFAVSDTGQLQSVTLQRWGNPENAAYHYVPFGGSADQEKTFDGYTIPTRLRVGWYFGTPQSDTDGEFFRCTIDHAEFR